MKSVSPTLTQVDVPSRTPESICKDTCAEPTRDATAQQEKSQFRHSWTRWQQGEIIATRLFERTWLEVQGVDFDPTLEPFKKLDKAIFKELCKNLSGVDHVLWSMRSGEPALGNYVASLVKDHLLPPPKKPSAISRFFSSLGKAISNICMCTSRVDVL